MDKPERRLKRIAIVVLKTSWPNSFSKFMFGVCNILNNACETYLLDKKL